MLILPNKIQLPNYFDSLEVLRESSHLFEVKLDYNYRKVFENLKKAKIPYAFKNTSSIYSHYGYSICLEYASIYLPDNITKNDLDQRFKEQIERYCQTQLISIL